MRSHVALWRWGTRTKKKTYGYRERPEAKRAAFRLQLARYAPEQLIYVDEAGVDNTHDYPYGYCHRTERFYALKLGHRTERISMVSGWRNRDVIAPFTFKSYCNTLLIEAWVEKMLVPSLKPGQVVVMAARLQQHREVLGEPRALPRQDATTFR